MYRVVPYTDDVRERWDTFVNTALFGTLFHTRRFLEYHPEDRYDDVSIMVYEGPELVCVVPCCATKEGAFSHCGATYGGIVVRCDKYTSTALPGLIDVVFEHYEQRLEMRMAGDIYFNESTHLLRYLLGCRLRPVLEISWHVPTAHNFSLTCTNKRNRKRLRQLMADENTFCTQVHEHEDYVEFYRMLSLNLAERHDTVPTHTLSELWGLQQRLDGRSQLYVARSCGRMVAGVFVLHVTSRCWYTMYICAMQDYSFRGAALMYLMLTVTEAARERGISFLDYGITTEHQGAYLNIGLAAFKEATLGGTSGGRYTFRLNK